MRTTFQNRFLDRVLEKFKNKSEAVEELASLLSVGKDAVYRRLRGETFLTPDEMHLLATTYHISLDTLTFETSDTVCLSFNVFKRKPKNFYDFINWLYNQLQEVRKAPGSSFYYASQEIPIFHYTYFPELICFKLYVWGLTTWDFPFLHNRPFTFDLVPPDVVEISRKINGLYNQVPTTELWSLNILDNTLNQIEYVATVEQFANPRDALVLCEKVLELVRHMRKMAEAGKKCVANEMVIPQGAVFHLYHNEMVYTNNTFLIRSEVGKMLITTFCNPNFFQTTDERLCDFTEEWLENIIQKSSSISAHSAKNRNWFFNKMEKKVKAAQHRIELIVEENCQ